MSICEQRWGQKDAFLQRSRLINEEDIPVAMDPEGFDRQSFLTDLNSRILSVFLSE